MSGRWVRIVPEKAMSDLEKRARGEAEKTIMKFVLSNDGDGPQRVLTKALADFAQQEIERHFMDLEFKLKACMEALEEGLKIIKLYNKDTVVQKWTASVKEIILDKARS